MKQFTFKHLPFSFFISLLLIFPISTFSQSENSLAREYYFTGLKHLKKKDYEGALKYFKDSLLEDPYNRDLNFQIGLVANRLGYYEEALFAFERALALDPKHIPSVLEKIRVLINLGALKQAREDLKQARSMNLTPEVRKNVEFLLAQISEKKEHVLSGVLVASQTWDSNASLGTAERIPLENFPDFLSEPTSTSDRILTGTFVGNHSYPLAEGGVWKNSLVVLASNHRMLDANEIDLITATTGLAYSFHNKHSYDVSASWAKINLKKQLYQTTVTFGGIYTFSPNPRHTLKLNYSWTRRHHYSLPGANGKDQTYGAVKKLGGSFTYISEEGRNILDLGYTYQIDTVSRDQDTPEWYQRYLGSLKYTRVAIPGILNISLGVNRRVDQYRQYHVARPDRMRLDRAFVGTFGMNIKVNQEFGIKNNIFLDLTGSATYNRSNVPESLYRSQQFVVSLTTLF